MSFQTSSGEIFAEIEKEYYTWGQAGSQDACPLSWPIERDGGCKEYGGQKAEEDCGN